MRPYDSLCPHELVLFCYIDTKSGLCTLSLSHVCKYCVCIITYDGAEIRSRSSNLPPPMVI